MSRWLIHEDEAASGAVQMARDEVALQRAARRQMPSLRLYTWERLTLSVGRGQQVERQIDLDACRRLGIPVVRRITGGRAVLHGSDLTYAVAAPLAGPQAGAFAAAARAGIPGLYRELSRVFVRFFATLGMEPQVQVYTGRQRAELASPVCFATPSAFEILLGGRKLVGSAQRLLPEAFLQHGSLPLVPQGDVLAQVFRDGAGEAMAEVMTDLTSAGVLPRLTLAEVRGRLLECFAAEFDGELAPTGWSGEEVAAVERLVPSYPDLAQVQEAQLDAPPIAAGT